jgi:hypothetical protein
MAMHKDHEVFIDIHFYSGYTIEAEYTEVTEVIDEHEEPAILDALNSAALTREVLYAIAHNLGDYDSVEQAAADVRSTVITVVTSKDRTPRRYSGVPVGKTL